MLSRVDLLSHSASLQAQVIRLLMIAAIASVTTTARTSEAQTNQSTIITTSDPAPAICNVNSEAADASQPESSSDASSAGNALRLSTTHKSGSVEVSPIQCKRPTGHGQSSSAEDQTPDKPADPPQTVEQPAAPGPKVSYSNGQLTVAGHGATFDEVMAAIRTQTGIGIEVPAGMADQHLFENVGPMPVREALVRLLDGTPFNYVLVSSTENPSLIRKVILTARGSGPSQAPQPVTSLLVREQVAGPALYGGDGFSTGADPSEVAAEAPANPPNGTTINPEVRQAAAASGKTPAQIIDELQKKQIQDLDRQYANQQQQ